MNSERTGQVRIADARVMSLDVFLFGLIGVVGLMHSYLELLRLLVP